ncbi:MAG: DUF4388 domain-containing protein [Polyangiaceae bacterium]
MDSLDGDGEQERPTSEYETLPSYVKTFSGHITGPFTFAALVESLATGLVGKDDYVDFMGRGYRRVGDLEDLVRYLPAVTATSGGVLGLGTPDFSDDLRSTPFGTILLRILAKNETGVLFVELPESTLDTGTHKELYFVGGRLHHVASSNAGELLGEYLVRRGMLSRSELDFALAVLSRYNGRIGDTLISLGLASAVDMFRAIRDQGRDRVSDVFSWPSGTVTFYRGQTAPHVEFPLELEIPDLLLAGLEAKQAKAEDFVEEYRGLLDKFVALPPVPNRTYRHVVWPAVVTRIVQMVTTPRRLRELMVSATRDGDLTAPEVLRAIEVAILSGLLRYQG